MLIWEAQPEPGGAEACPVAERCGQLRQLRVNTGSFGGCLAVGRPLEGSSMGEREGWPGASGPGIWGRSRGWLHGVS